MFDAEATLSAVEAGEAPEFWTVYRATESYFALRGLLAGYVGVMLLAFLGLFIVMVGVPSGGDWGLYAFLALMGLVIALVGLGSCLLSFAYFKEMRTRGRRILVLTPDGFVERKDSADGSRFAVEYAGIASIAMTAGGTRSGEVVVHMTFTTTNGNRETWEIGLWFSPAATIAQQIIQAHTKYHVAATSAGG